VRSLPRRTALLAVVLLALLAPTLVSAPAQAAGHRTKVRAAWSATSVVVGTPVTVSGVIKDGVKHARKVQVQQRLGGRWHTVATGRTARNGRYALPVDTSWLYRSKVRVRAPRTRGAGADSSKATWLTVGPGYAPAGSPAAWTLVTPGSLARWNPCRVIRYQVRPGGLGANLVTAVQAGLADVTVASGLRFEYAGTTDLVPASKSVGGPWPAGVDLVIAGVTPQEAAAVGVPDVQGGVGGPRDVVRGRDQSGWMWKIRTGTVWINSTQYFPDVATNLLQLVKHELGHAMGLGHHDDPYQFMNPGDPIWVLPPRVWGAGDLAGFARLGLQRGCVK
jgi:hypothetical protein